MGDIRFGWDEVIEIQDSHTHPIVVQFDKRKKKYITESKFTEKLIN